MTIKVFEKVWRIVPENFMELGHYAQRDICEQAIAVAGKYQGDFATMVPWITSNAYSNRLWSACSAINAKQLGFSLDDCESPYLHAASAMRCMYELGRKHGREERTD